MGTYINENGTFDLIRKLNLDKVYKTILLNSAISRAEIAEKTGLNKATVSTCVNMLLSDGVAEEIGLSASSGGRPPTIVSLRKDFGIFIAIEINKIKGKVLVTDLTGQIIESNTLSDVQEDPKQFLCYVSSLVERYQAVNRTWKFGIMGICLIFPINYNERSGCIEHINSMPKWNHVEILQIMKKQFPNIPIFIKQANIAGALGEIHFGNSDPLKYMVYVLGNWGLSLALYAEGTECYGRNGFAGRFGHTIIEKDGRTCVCGNRGCLEAYASIRPLVEKLEPGGVDHYESIMRILDRKKRGDPQFLTALKETQDYFALGLVNIINTYNPEEICIGGYMGKLLEGAPLREILEQVYAMILPNYKKGLHIYTSRLGEMGPIYGGISLIRDNLVNIILSHRKSDSKDI